MAFLLEINATSKNRRLDIRNKRKPLAGACNSSHAIVIRKIAQRRFFPREFLAKLRDENTDGSNLSKLYRIIRGMCVISASCVQWTINTEVYEVQFLARTDKGSLGSSPYSEIGNT